MGDRQLYVLYAARRQRIDRRPAPGHPFVVQMLPPFWPGPPTEASKVLSFPAARVIGAADRPGTRASHDGPVRWSITTRARASLVGGDCTLSCAPAAPNCHLQAARCRCSTLHSGDASPSGPPSSPARARALTAHSSQLSQLPRREVQPNILLPSTPIGGRSRCSAE